MGKYPLHEANKFGSLGYEEYELFLNCSFYYNTYITIK